MLGTLGYKIELCVHTGKAKRDQRDKEAIKTIRGNTMAEKKGQREGQKDR